MPQSRYITPATIARKIGVSPDTARRYIAEVFPKTAPPRAQQRFDAERLDELARLCESKRQRRCLNAFNSTPRPTDAK